MENTNKGYIYLLQLCDEKKKQYIKLVKQTKLNPG
jgi:hypothetical protein